MRVSINLIFQQWSGVGTGVLGHHGPESQKWVETQPWCINEA